MILKNLSIIAIIALFTIQPSIQDEKIVKSSAVDENKFKQQNLLCHNKYREKHGVKPLSYHDKLHKIAQSYAEVLADKDEGLVHSDTEYGENLHGSLGMKVDGHLACDSWYDEINMYDFKHDQPDNLKAVGHFTQMVWKGTCFMGVGLATAKSGWTYVVANYDPMGNTENKFRSNVLPTGIKSSPNRTLSPFQELMTEELVMCSDADMKTFHKQNLECHNIIRKRHRVKPLKYNTEMNDLAQKKADMLAKDGKLSPDQSNYGQNIFSASSGKLDGHGACKFWYEGSNVYDYDSDNITSQAFSFTQMVWKSSEETGAGISRSKDGKIYVVSLYNPPGNILGQFKDNVLPPEEEEEIPVHHKPVKPSKTEKKPSSPVKGPSDVPPISHKPAKPPKVEKEPSKEDPKVELLKNKTEANQNSSSIPSKFITPDGHEINLKSFAEQHLGCLNEFRKLHGADPLIYDGNLNALAQELATDFARSKDRKKLKGLPYGFAMYSSSRKKMDGSIACKFWYKGKPFGNYPFDDPPKIGKREYLPFTQLVWKASRQTGLGVSLSESGKIHIVSLFDPPGNVNGLYSENVAPRQTNHD